MRLGLQTPIINNHAALYMKLLYPQLLKRKSWAFLNAFSKSIRASNLMIEIEHRIHKSILNCFPVCFCLQYRWFNLWYVYTLAPNTQQERNWMSNQMSSELMNSKVTRRKGCFLVIEPRCCPVSYLRSPSGIISCLPGISFFIDVSF